MRVKVIRHHAEDSPGFIAAAFEARGAEITTHLFPAEGPLAFLWHGPIPYRQIRAPAGRASPPASRCGSSSASACCRWG